MASLGLCHKFIGELGYVRTVSGVFDGDRADVSSCVEVQQSVLVQIPGLGDLCSLEFYVQGIRFLKIFDLHSMNLRIEESVVHGFPVSKKYNPEISAVHFPFGAQRRILPSTWISSFTGCSITRMIHSDLITMRSGRCCIA